MTVDYSFESILHALRALPRFEEILRDSVFNPDSLAAKIVSVYDKYGFSSCILECNIQSKLVDVLLSLENDTVVLPFYRNPSSAYRYVNYALTKSINSIPFHLQRYVSALLQPYQIMINAYIGITANMQKTMFTAAVENTTSSCICGQEKKFKVVTYVRWSDIFDVPETREMDCTCGEKINVRFKKIIYYPEVLIVSVDSTLTPLNLVFAVNGKKNLTFFVENVPITYRLTGMILENTDGTHAASVLLGNKWVSYQKNRRSVPADNSFINLPNSKPVYLLYSLE